MIDSGSKECSLKLAKIHRQSHGEIILLFLMCLQLARLYKCTGKAMAWGHSYSSTRPDRCTGAAMAQVLYYTRLQKQKPPAKL